MCIVLVVYRSVVHWYLNISRLPNMYIDDLYNHNCEVNF